MPTLTPQLLRSRLGKICVAITAATASELVEKAASTLKEQPFFEARLDFLPKPLEGIKALQPLLAAHPNATAIATCRRTESGGQFTGTLAEELQVLSKAAVSGFHLIDLPIESAEALKPSDLQKLRATGVCLLLSYHDFTATRDLDAIFERMQQFSPDFIKIVSTAKTLSDNLTLLRLLERRSETANIVGISMGAPGTISRILGVRAGSAFTFASVVDGEETAPGQIAARTLQDMYRVDELDAATRVYGVAGNPVSHSLSPLMLNTAFRREKLNSVYLPLQSSKISDLLELAREIPLQGLSITMPFKQEILKRLEHTDALSAKIGACNTLLRGQDAKWYGFNTDVAGVVAPLERRLSLAGAKILVLGAGGAARAAVFGLREKRAEVFVLNRTAETAQKLAKQSGSKAIKRTDLGKMRFDAIVNATPLGMTGYKGKTPLEQDELNTGLVFDLVYTPLETPLLRMARQRGIGVITGVEMFVQQGARQFEIWTGKPAPEEEMLGVVLRALKQRAEAGEHSDKPKAAQPAPAEKQAASPLPLLPKKKPAAARKQRAAS